MKFMTVRLLEKACQRKASFALEGKAPPAIDACAITFTQVSSQWPIDAGHKDGTTAGCRSIEALMKVKLKSVTMYTV
jgi:hypothetical protein